MKLVREHEESLPVSPELIERAIRSTGNAPKVIQAVADLKIPDKKSSFDNYLTSLVLNTLWDWKFDIPEFSSIRRARSYGQRLTPMRI